MTLAGRMQRIFNIEDWKTWEGRWELIGGEAFDMAPPGLEHQAVLGHLHAYLYNVLSISQAKGGTCRPYVAPFALFLGDDVLEPDLAIICDPAIEHADGIHGAPDLIVEILSPSTSCRDLGLKRSLYEAAGVPEYLIIHPLERWAQLLHLQDGHYVEDPRIAWPGRVSLLRGRLELPLGEWDPVPTSPGSASHRPFTLEDWKTWEGRWELIGGEAFDLRPAPRLNHQEALGSLHAHIHLMLSRDRAVGGTCRPYMLPVTLFLGDDVLEPDLMVVCDPSRIHSDGIHGAPALVVEILSVHTSFKDLEIKREVYESAGIPEYLIIDPDDRWAQLLVLRDGSYQEGRRLVLPARLRVLGGRLDLPLGSWD